MVGPLSGVSMAAAASALLGLLAVSAAGATISNVTPRRLTNGSIIRVQDGNLLHHNNTWYWFGMAYGLCEEQPRGCTNTSVGACGFRYDHGLMLLSSPTLAMDGWTLVSTNVLPVDSRPAGVYFRPKLLYNAATRLFVVWSRWVAGNLANLSDHYVTATSPTIAGPYTVVNRDVRTHFSGGADQHVWVDDDGVAYLVYTSHGANVTVSVERLDANFTASTLHNSGPFGARGEAPSMFKRAGWYYVTYGHLCCFCAGGSNLWVYAAKAPLGPYALVGDINTNASGVSTTSAQQNFVFALPPSPTGNVTYVSTGNRWQSAPDHLKDHDFHYWETLQWNDGVQPPAPAPLRWVDTFTL